jgi:putative transposase
VAEFSGTHTTKRQRSRRPPTSPSLRRVILRLTAQNPDWGYRHIAAELADMGHQIGASTIWTILQRAGTHPAPQRSGPTRGRVLRSQAHGIPACDFCHGDTVLLTRLSCLAVIEHATHRIHIPGITAHLTADWLTQQAHNLLMDLGDHAAQFTFLIRDQDSTFTSMFDAIFTSEDIQIITAPIRAPHANSIMERWVGSLRRELLDRMLIVNAQHLRHVLAEYENHTTTHRPHRSLTHTAPLRALPQPNTTNTKVIRRDRLDGAIHEYMQVAWGGRVSGTPTRRHRLTADSYRREMTSRFATWNDVVGLPTAS